MVTKHILCLAGAVGDSRGIFFVTPRKAITLDSERVNPEAPNKESEFPEDRKD